MQFNGNAQQFLECAFFSPVYSHLKGLLALSTPHVGVMFLENLCFNTTRGCLLFYQRESQLLDHKNRTRVRKKKV